jgi:Concanavalin A-like lectin/glucanases superfamily/PA14 domain/Bacterial Ig-like domain
MIKHTPHKVWPGLLAALTVGAAAANAQAPKVIAHWDFEKIEADGVSIKTSDGKYVGTITDAAVLTASGEGRPGGGKGFDVSVNNGAKGYLKVEATGDDNPMNLAAAEDAVTVVLWQKNFSNINSSSFWVVADSQGRSFQAHVPWSNGQIYFDTSGCCASPLQRLSQAAPEGFDFNEWHHYAFVKNGGAKAIYIDGELLAEQTEGVDILPTDNNTIYIGAASDSNAPDGIIDDFAIFKGALSQDDIKKLAAGASPGVPPVDTDKDGMPDDWETQYGFNPNDPSDAALDFDKDGTSNLDEFKNGSDPVDVTKPVLNAAVGAGNFATVTLTFSENLDPVTAVNTANYTLTPSVAVTAATVKKNVVTLTTAAQTPGATAYTVTVNNVLDNSKNAIAANSTALFYSYLNVKSGVLKISTWTGIPGDPVQNLYDDPRYPATPDSVGAVFSFNSRDYYPTDSLEAYGATIEGYLTPTETGDYHFFDRSDDSSELYISTDDKEANLAVQAFESDCCEPFMEPGSDDATTATPVSLVANKKYFIRLVYKEGGGGDYGQVAWRKAGDTTPAGSLQPIPGQFLSSAVDLPAPPQGAILAQVPAPKAKNVSPATGIRFSHRDGKTEWTSANVSMTLNGVSISPTITKAGNVLSLSYVPPALLASASIHTVAVNYLDAGGNPAKEEWSFSVLTYSGPSLDKVASYPALITGAAAYTADKGGHSGLAGDYAMDHGRKGGSLIVPNAGWANAATAADSLSVSFWTKKYDRADNSAFWFNSPTFGRAMQAHLPWSDNSIYYDTGCCTTDTQRISANLDTFPGYTGDDGFLTNSWHHFVFTKKADVKEIWIDGVLFLSGSGANPLASDIDTLYIGSENATGGLYHGLFDDFAVFSSQLAEADAKALFNGASPSTLTTKGLIAFWDFNTVIVAPPTVGIAGSIITYTGTLQSSATLGGAFTAVAGATSPYTIPAGTTAQYYRASQ